MDITSLLRSYISQGCESFLELSKQEKLKLVVLYIRKNHNDTADYLGLGEKNGFEDTLFKLLFTDQLTKEKALDQITDTLLKNLESHLSEMFDDVFAEMRIAEAEQEPWFFLKKKSPPNYDYEGNYHNPRNYI